MFRVIIALFLSLAIGSCGSSGGGGGGGGSSSTGATSITYTIGATMTLDVTPTALVSSGSGTTFKVIWNPDTGGTKYPNGNQPIVYVFNQSSPPTSSTTSIQWIVSSGSTTYAGTMETTCTYTLSGSTPVLNCGAPVKPGTSTTVGLSGPGVNAPIDMAQYPNHTGYIILRIENEYRSMAVTLN